MAATRGRTSARGMAAAIAVLSRPRASPALVAGLMAGMGIGRFLALVQAGIAHMIAVKRLPILFAIRMGACFFAKCHLGHRVIAGSMMVGGVALVAL